MDQDPFELLGIDPSSTVDDVHRGPSPAGACRPTPIMAAIPARMQAINAAVDAALIALSRPPTAPAVVEQAGDEPAAATAGARHASAAGGSTTAPSFTIEALPAEAFEALLVVATWIGEVLDDDPPYVLEAHLGEPFDCWCRLELVPDAGASTVSLVVATFGDDCRPTSSTCATRGWRNLNQLDWAELHDDRLGSAARPS